MTKKGGKKDKNISGNNDMFVMDKEGQNLRQLTDYPSEDRHPTWILVAIIHADLPTVPT